MISAAKRDTLFGFVIRFLAMTSAGIMFLVCVFVARESWLAFSSGDGDFQLTNLATDDAWNPAGQQFNLVPMIVGSWLATVGSAFLAAPLGIGVAVFLNYYAPRNVSWVVRRLVEMMAGVPSVVYGLWGMSVLVPMIAMYSPLQQGQSLLAGILILAFMTVPTIIVASDAAIQAVPASYIRGAAALGMGRSATIWTVVIPAARLGLITAVILQFARAIGETMAVLMVCGNIVKTPNSIFEPVRTLTANIALEMGYAGDHHRSVLFLSGLVGLAVVTVFMLAANFLSNSRHPST